MTNLCYEGHCYWFFSSTASTGLQLLMGAVMQLPCSASGTAQEAAPTGIVRAPLESNMLLLTATGSRCLLPPPVEERSAWGRAPALEQPAFCLSSLSTLPSESREGSVWDLGDCSGSLGLAAEGSAATWLGVGCHCLGTLFSFHMLTPYL